MVRAAVVALALTVVESRVYQQLKGYDCYEGYGGTPLSGNDTSVGTMPLEDCQARCDSEKHCVSVVVDKVRLSYLKKSGCWLYSRMELDKCDHSTTEYDTYVISSVPTPPPSPPAPTPTPSPTPSYNRRRHYPPAPTPPQPPLTGNIVYHLFEPKFTGLANRDAGDFKGDMGFIFGTFASYEVGNPEASIEHNIFEMSEVNVTGWGKYEECNAPGCTGLFTCPNGTEYCCTTGRKPPVLSNHTKDQLPGLEKSSMSLGHDFGFSGWWFSFPKESQGTTWSEKLLRRVSGKCVGDAWRKDAGGCSQCGESLDSCVADCIKATLAKNGSTDLLQKTWDRVFSSKQECPDVSLPSQTVVV